MPTLYNVLVSVKESRVLFSSQATHSSVVIFWELCVG